LHEGFAGEGGSRAFGFLKKKKLETFMGALDDGDGVSLSGVETENSNTKVAKTYE